MKDYKVILLFSLFIGINWGSWGQTITVLSKSSHQPLPKARIDVNNGEKVLHFQTNLEGQWEIKDNLVDKPIYLRISYHGFIDFQSPLISITKDTSIYLLPKVKKMDGVVVTAQYKKQRLEEAVHNIKIIDRQQIEAMNAQNVQEALSKELNIHQSRDNVLGSSIQIQGIGGQNVKILVDGVPLTGRLNGNIDLSQIPIDNVKRIEVVEGPLSVSYGTDALAGTINIITKKNQSHHFVARTNNYFESSGRMNNNLSLGWKWKKNQIRIHGGRQFFDGWNPGQPVFNFKQPVADSTRVQLWNPKIQYFGGLNYRFRGDHSVIDYSGNYMNEKVIDRGAPRAPFNTTAFDNYFHTTRVRQRINYQLWFADKYRITLTGGYSGYFRKKNRKIRDLTTIEDVLTSNPADQDTSQYHSFLARGRFIQAAPSSKINYEIGFDLSYEIAHGNKIEKRKQDVGDYAIYATAEYSPIDQLTIRPGLRYGYNTNYNAPVTPSINIRYGIFDQEKQALILRGSYARGFRSPSIKELYYTFVDANHNIIGNPNLSAETSNNFNLSLHYNFNKKDFGIRNKLALFYNDIRNQITLAQATVSEYSYFNLNQYVTTGAQLESNLHYKQFYAGLGIGYVGRYNKIHSDEDFKIDKFLFSPNISVNLQYEWEKIGMKFALFYKYCGVLPQVVSDENGKYSLETLQDYHLASFKVAKYFWKKRLEISLGVKNIFNVVTVAGSEGEVIKAHSSGGGGVTVGMGRTYNLGIKFTIKSK